MARSARELSMSDLQRMLNDRKSQLGSLEKRRERLQKELDVVDRRIDELEGRGGGAVRSRTRRRAIKRPENVKSLHAYVKETLAKNKKGLTLEELSNKVLSAGYKTNSTNFKNVLYQCVYNSSEVRHDEKSGTYKLVKPQTEKAAAKEAAAT
jgi:hypothetical protein